MKLFRIHLNWVTAALATLLCVNPAWAQLRVLSEHELSSTRGQGFMALTNSSYGGFDFSRITFGADVNLNANFKNIRLGEYSHTPNGTGADIDIPLLQYGRSDGSAAQRLVSITNPYIEFVYRNASDVAQREVVGMRVGFEGISGDVGLTLATLSGSMRIDGVDYTGKRLDGASLPNVGGIKAGDTIGSSNDYWISVLKTAVQFQPPPGVAQLPGIAQAGFWLNWRDKLSAINANGLPPPNLPLAR